MSFIKAILYLLIVSGLVKANQFDELEECSPLLADACFEGFLTSLSNITEISAENPTEALCGAIADRITCSKIIIDTDCELNKGRANFDKWMAGIDAVYTYLCETSPSAMTDLIETMEGSCWDIKDYVECIEHKTHITHILDMLKVRLTLVECKKQAALFYVQKVISCLLVYFCPYFMYFFV